MKQKRKMRFKYYIILLFLLCIFLYNFGTGFYDGFRYGEIEMQQSGTSEDAGTVGQGGYPGKSARHNVQDNTAYALIAFGISVLFFVLINRKIDRPLKILIQNMERIAKGDLKARAETDAPLEFQQIERSFNTMAEALQKAEDEKRQQENNNQQLYANIAHDLKSPITMILGYARTLERGAVADEAKKQEYLRTICEQIGHVNELLDKLLAYTRLENQAFALKKEEQDLAETLRSCVAQFYPAFEEHGTTPDIDIPEKACIYCFDAVEMKRVFENLLLNMVRHTAYATECRIEMKEEACKEDGRKCIRIRFADKGPKIEESVRAHLFEPFCVGDASRNTRGGSGLGLSVAKKVIERHEGRLFYEEAGGEEWKAFVIELYAD